MNSTLVIVTFLAGTAWGPNVQMIKTASNKECSDLALKVQRQIIETAKSNMTGGEPRVESSDNGNFIVAPGAKGRDMASLNCY